MPAAPIILVPGFWLGAWAWDEVAATLRAEGHDVTALTMPGLDSVDTDRSVIRLEDNVNAIVDAVRSAGRPVVLAVHSGSGSPGYAASDRVPELIAAMVYVDSGPANGPLGPDFEGVEMPLPSWDEIRADPSNSLEGISDQQLETFRQRAVPQPGASLRDAPSLTNDARLDVPTVFICCALSSDDIKEAIEAGHSFVGGLAELRNVRYVDLPTSHWPMFSRPQELASIIGDVSKQHGSPIDNG